MRSETFRLRRMKCYLLMMLEDASWLFWAVIVVALALIVAGFIVSPWIGIAAIGVATFLMVMALSFVIMAYGFHSMTGVNMTEHRLSLDKDSIRVEFEEGDPIEIPRKETGKYKIYPGGVVVPVKGIKTGWLWIPSKAFSRPENFRDFLKGLYERKN